MLRVVDVVYVIQGDGPMAGVPVVKVLTAGCSMGCKFCNQDYTEGARDWNAADTQMLYECGARWVSIGGGEPLDQNLTEFLAECRNAGKLVHLETNGAHSYMPELFDYITVSPKVPALALKAPAFDELRVLYHTDQQDLAQWFSTDVERRLRGSVRTLQPLERPPGSGICNYRDTVLAVKRDPRWRLAVQVNRLVGIS